MTGERAASTPRRSAISLESTAVVRQCGKAIAWAQRAAAACVIGWMLSATGVASAQVTDEPAAVPGPPPWMSVAVPPQFAVDAGQGKALAAELADRRVFGEVAASGDAATYTSSADGVVVWVWWLESDEPPASAEVAARAAIERVRRIPEAAALAADDARLLAWNESVTDGVARANLRWRHVANHTNAAVVTVVWARSDGNVAQATVECFAQAEMEGATARCETIANSLELTAAAEPRPLGTLPEARDLAADEPAPAAHDSAATRAPLAPSLGAPPEGGVIMRVEQPAARSTDQSWMYVVGGLLLLIAIYLTTRSRTKDQEHR